MKGIGREDRTGTKLRQLGPADRSQHSDVFKSLRTFFSLCWKKSFKVIGFLVWLPLATLRSLISAC